MKKRRMIGFIALIGCMLLAGCGETTMDGGNDTNGLPGEPNATQGRSMDNPVGDAVDGAGNAVRDAANGVGDAAGALINGAENVVNDVTNGAQNMVDGNNNNNNR